MKFNHKNLSKFLLKTFILGTVCVSIYGQQSIAGTGGRRGGKNKGSLSNVCPDLMERCYGDWSFDTNRFENGDICKTKGMQCIEEFGPTPDNCTTILNDCFSTNCAPGACTDLTANKETAKGCLMGKSKYFLFGCSHMIASRAVQAVNQADSYNAQIKQQQEMEALRKQQEIENARIAAEQAAAAKTAQVERERIAAEERQKQAEIQKELELQKQQQAYEAQQRELEYQRQKQAEEDAKNTPERQVFKHLAGISRNLNNKITDLDQAKNMTGWNNTNNDTYDGNLAWYLPNEYYKNNDYIRDGDNKAYIYTCNKNETSPIQVQSKLNSFYKSVSDILNDIIATEDLLIDSSEFIKNMDSLDCAYDIKSNYLNKTQNYISLLTGKDNLSCTEESLLDISSPSSIPSIDQALPARLEDTEDDYNNENANSIDGNYKGKIEGDERESFKSSLLSSTSIPTVKTIQAITHSNVLYKRINSCLSFIKSAMSTDGFDYSYGRTSSSSSSGDNDLFDRNSSVERIANKLISNSSGYERAYNALTTSNFCRTFFYTNNPTGLDRLDTNSQGIAFNNNYSDKKIHQLTSTELTDLEDCYSLVKTQLDIDLRGLSSPAQQPIYYQPPYQGSNQGINNPL